MQWNAGCLVEQYASRPARAGGGVAAVVKKPYEPSFCLAMVNRCEPYR
jgi:hypothetical protein